MVKIVNNDIFNVMGGPQQLHNFRTLHIASIAYAGVSFLFCIRFLVVKAYNNYDKLMVCYRFMYNVNYVHVLSCPILPYGNCPSAQCHVSGIILINLSKRLVH